MKRKKQSKAMASSDSPSLSLAKQERLSSNVATISSLAIIQLVIGILILGAVVLFLYTLYGELETLFNKAGAASDAHKAAGEAMSAYIATQPSFSNLIRETTQ